MKSVAYMMDTNAWNSKFKDVNNKAEYVIGGPTIELLFKSYNDKYKTEYEFQATNATGYQIRKTANDSWSNGISSMLKTSDSLYVISSQSDALAYWVASPSAATGYQIRKTANDSWSNGISSMLKTSDSLYVISSQSDALAYWVASPSANGTDYVMNVSYDGYVNYSYSSNYCIGFRPLVSLKSDVQLQKNEDGTYTIL